jgi:hypothetical protein
MTAEQHQRDAESVVREIQLEGGGLIVYDTDEEGAWIQADRPTTLG